jgi:hypothetical protein
MAETGHAKNVANFETALLALVALGAAYNPTQPLILLAALQTALASAQASLTDTSEKAAQKTIAVDARENEYAGLGKFATKIAKAAAVDINDAAFNADMQTLVRLLNGKRAGAKPVDDPTTPDVNEALNTHSVSQLSYDNLEANFGKLITLLETKGNYKPNETEFQIAALKAKHNALKATNLAAKTASINADNARSARDEILYHPETGILNLVGLIKKYLDYAFGKDSPVYQQINALKFKKVK